jgi:mannosyltransferase
VSATATFEAEALPAAPAPAPTRPHGVDLITVALPTALAAALTLVGLTSRSLGFDEAASVTIALQHGHAFGNAIAHDGGNMSGYYLLLHAVAGVFGRGLEALRLPSAVFAAATVALVTMLGLRLFDRRVALLAGLICAVSLPLVFWGQSARGYAPMVAFTTASWLSFVSMLEHRRHAGVAYVICTVIAIYSSFVAILAVAAQLVVWRRRDVRPFLAGALCCVPLVVLALERGSGQLFWVPRPSLHSTWQVLQTLASAGLPPSFRIPSAVTIVLTVVTVTIISLARRPRTRLLLSWLLVPLALALGESLVAQSIFLPRNLLVSLPPVALLLAVGLTHPRVPAPAASVLVVLLIALRAMPLASAAGVSPEDWKAATAYVREHARPSDCIAFYPADARMGFAYYGRAGRPVLPADAWGALHAYVEDYATAPISGCPRLWLVSSHEGQSNGPAGSRANYARFVALRALLRDEYAREWDARFGYAAVITVRLLSRP